MSTRQQIAQKQRSNNQVIANALQGIRKTPTANSKSGNDNIDILAQPTPKQPNPVGYDQADAYAMDTFDPSIETDAPAVHTLKDVPVDNRPFQAGSQVSLEAMKSWLGINKQYIGTGYYHEVADKFNQGKMNQSFTTGSSVRGESDLDAGLLYGDYAEARAKLGEAISSGNNELAVEARKELSNAKAAQYKYGRIVGNGQGIFDQDGFINGADAAIDLSQQEIAKMPYTMLNPIDSATADLMDAFEQEGIELNTQTMETINNAALAFAGVELGSSVLTLAAGAFTGGTATPAAVITQQAAKKAMIKATIAKITGIIGSKTASGTILKGSAIEGATEFVQDGATSLLVNSEGGNITLEEGLKKAAEGATIGALTGGQVSGGTRATTFTTSKIKNSSVVKSPFAGAEKALLAGARGAVYVMSRPTFVKNANIQKSAGFGILASGNPAGAIPFSTGSLTDFAGKIDNEKARAKPLENIMTIHERDRKSLNKLKAASRGENFKEFAANTTEETGTLSSMILDLASDMAVNPNLNVADKINTMVDDMNVPIANTDKLRYSPEQATRLANEMKQFAASDSFQGMIKEDEKYLIQVSRKVMDKATGEVKKLSGKEIMKRVADNKNLLIRQYLEQSFIPQGFVGGGSNVAGNSAKLASMLSTQLSIDGFTDKSESRTGRMLKDGLAKKFTRRVSPESVSSSQRDYANTSESASIRESQQDFDNMSPDYYEFHEETKSLKSGVEAKINQANETLESLGMDGDIEMPSGKSEPISTNEMIAKLREEKAKPKAQAKQERAQEGYTKLDKQVSSSPKQAQKLSNEIEAIATEAIEKAAVVDQVATDAYQAGIRESKGGNQLDNVNVQDMENYIVDSVAGVEPKVSKSSLKVAPELSFDDKLEVDLINMLAARYGDTLTERKTIIEARKIIRAMVDIWQRARAGEKVSPPSESQMKMVTKIPTPYVDAYLLLKEQAEII